MGLRGRPRFGDAGFFWPSSIGMQGQSDEADGDHDQDVSSRVSTSIGAAECFAGDGPTSACGAAACGATDPTLACTVVLACATTPRVV